MQKGLAWLLAAGMLAAAVWIAGPAWDGRRQAPAAGPGAVEGAAAAAAAKRELPWRSVVLRRSEAEAALPADPSDAGHAPGDSAAAGIGSDPSGVGGVDGGGGRPGREAAGRGSEARGARGAASDAPSELADPADPGALADPEVEIDLARWAEDHQLLSEPELDARADRERRRGAPDAEAAEQKVWTDAALAWYLASLKAGPDATQAQIKPYVDSAYTLISTLPPDRKAALQQRAADALPSMGGPG